MAASLIAAGLTAVAVTLAIPDPRHEPLEEILPEDWRETTTTQSGDTSGSEWEELFTHEAREAEQLEVAIVQAIRSGAAVQAYVTVQEGDGRNMTSLLKHHIRTAGGYVADTSPYRHHVWAAVLKSYLPCLQQATKLVPGEKPPTPYRQFAISVFEQRHQCPLENDGDSSRMVHISVTEEPIGLITDAAAMGLAAAIMWVLIIVYTIIVAATIVNTRPRSQPGTAVENAVTS